MSGHKILSDLLARAVRIYANYVRSVGSRDERIGIDSNQKIQVINECVAQMVANEDINDSVKTALLNHYAQAYDARNDRFDLLEQRLPLRVWLLLSVFSLAWIWGFFWIDFSTDSLSAYICSCTVFSVTVLFGYALDMDNPIKGFWRMDFTPFVQNKF